MEKQELSFSFEIAGSINRALLIANLAIRGHDIQRK
jgi:hypothetical protein